MTRIAEDQEKTQAATCKDRSSFLYKQWKDETSQEGYKEDKNTTRIRLTFKDGFDRG